jgi:hypothetical protein
MPASRKQEFRKGLQTTYDFQLSAAKLSPKPGRYGNFQVFPNKQEMMPRIHEKMA